MDCLSIKSLSINTRIGVHAWEQRISQRLLLDIDIYGDFSNCEDDIDKTIDYDKLCQLVSTFIESQSFKLIETVANQVAELLLKECAVGQISVSVSKPHAIKTASDVRISVTRSKTTALN